jgi:hypothetical protein
VASIRGEACCCRHIVSAQLHPRDQCSTIPPDARVHVIVRRYLKLISPDTNLTKLLGFFFSVQLGYAIEHQNLLVPTSCNGWVSSTKFVRCRQPQTTAGYRALNSPDANLIKTAGYHALISRWEHFYRHVHLRHLSATINIWRPSQTKLTLDSIHSAFNWHIVWMQILYFSAAKKASQEQFEEVYINAAIVSPAFTGTYHPSRHIIPHRQLHVHAVSIFHLYLPTLHVPILRGSTI